VEITRRSMLVGAAVAGDVVTSALAEGAPNPIYPDPAFKVLDPSFLKYRPTVVGVERLATGLTWSEGPVWFGDGRYLLWSDIPNNRLVLLCHKFRCPFRTVQHGQRDSVAARATTNFRRIVAIEFGTWRSGRNGGSSRLVDFT
jgi:sugar lactone lactonase YvrE